MLRVARREIGVWIWTESGVMLRIGIAVRIRTNFRKVGVLLRIALYNRINVTTHVNPKLVDIMQI